MRPATDFGSDQSKSFAADARSWAARPEPDHRRRTPEQDTRGSEPRETSRPWQDRTNTDRPARDRAGTDRAPQRTGSDRPREDRGAWRDRPTDDRRSGGPSDRSSFRTGAEQPRFERREPDRGSRVREEEIGERWPDVPEWADPRELDPEVRRDLRGLSKEGSEFVAGHLFMAGMLADEDPALAWRHARAARSKGGRIAVVRETVGLVAYRAGEWAEAISELRAARRMSGGPGQLPVMADCERALGHPEKAIELSRSAEAAELDPSSAAELTIVVAGARADMGQLDAALANLESAVRTSDVEPYTARLFYAYADLLLQADRRDEAIEYFMKAADLDVEEETDAGERLTELADEEAESTGTKSTDFVLDDDDDDDDATGDEALTDSDDDEWSDDTDDRAIDGGATASEAAEQPDDGAFYSDPAEQEKLLMSDDDDEDDAPLPAAEAGSTGTAGLTAQQAQHLERDDDQAQASTEVPAITPDAGAPDAAADTTAAEDDHAPEPVEAVTPAPEAVTKDRSTTPPGSTGSLFSHHEGGL